MGAQWVRPENPEDFETTYKLPSFSAVFYNGTNADGTPNMNKANDYQALDLYFPFFLTLQVIKSLKLWNYKSNEIVCNNFVFKAFFKLHG